MANRFCTSCGAPLEEDKKFCTQCGSPAAAESAGERAMEPVSAARPAGAFAAVQAPLYQAPPAPVPAPSDGEPTGRYAPIGTLSWIGIFLLLLIPVVNIVLLIVWAAGGCQKATKRSFARATLIFIVISIILGMAAGYFVKKAVNGFLQESGITRQFSDSPGGVGVEELFGTLTGDNSSSLSGGALTDDNSSSLSGGALTDDDISGLPKDVPAPGNEADALTVLFPDGQFNEQTLRDMGCSAEEIEMIRAVMENDRKALLDMGYSEQEVDMVLDMFR